MKYEIVPYNKYVIAAARVGKSELLPRRDFQAVYDAEGIEGCTDGERCILFCHQFITVQTGMASGKELVLDDYQQAFILAFFDGEAVEQGILTIGRRAGKTFLASCILLSYMFNLVKQNNQQIASCALSRSQAALIFNQMKLIIAASPQLRIISHIKEAAKQIVATPTNTTYTALSADSGRNLGQDLAFLVSDESGALLQETYPLLDALKTSMGSQKDGGKMVTISTQGKNETCYLTKLIQSGTENPNVVCHVYTTPPESEWMNEESWLYSNPTLGKFRSVADMRKLMKEAELSGNKSSIANYLLNQIVNTHNSWLEPTAWALSNQAVDDDVFRTSKHIVLSLDLSSRVDMTAAVLCAKDDDGHYHFKTFCFLPDDGNIERRATKDKMPYQDWIANGHLTLVGERVISLLQVCNQLQSDLDDLGVGEITALVFDRWGIDSFKSAARETNFLHPENSTTEWISHGQGFVSMHPAMQVFQDNLLNENLRIQSPVANAAISICQTVSDSAGSLKLCKKNSVARIDVLIAMIMALSVCASPEPTEAVLDVQTMIG